MRMEYPDDKKFISLSEIAEINPPNKTASNLSDDVEVSFIPMSDTTESGRWVNHQIRRYREVKHGYTSFEEGDVLFAKITPCTENGKGCLAVGLRNKIGFGSTEFHVLRANSKGDSGFIFQWSISKELRQKASASMTGSAGQQRVPASFFSRYLIPRLSKTEQTQIATILSTIDRAIEQTEFLIAKQQRIKTGLMQDLLTKGIDEHGNIRSEETHEFKDSPLGRIPVEWNVVSILETASSELHSTAIGPFGSNLVASDYREEGVPVVFVRDIKEGVFNWISNVFVSSQKAKNLKAHRVSSHDVVATKMGIPPCIAAVYPDGMGDGVITADVIKLTPNDAIAEPSWLAMSLNTERVRSQVRRITGGVTRPKITLRDFRDLLIPLPQQKEQRQIITAIESMHSCILRRQLEIEKYRKTKTGLMQDLLTGKVRVTDLLDLPPTP